MSNESARQFLDKMREDADLFKQAAACKTREERLAWVKGLGYDFTSEQLKHAFDELTQKGQLTDHELEMVAGGQCCGGTCENDMSGVSCGNFNTCAGNCQD